MSLSDVAGLTREVQLKQVLDLSINMVEQAGRGEWEQIAEMERLRRDNMMAALKAPLREEEKQEVHDSLQQIVQLNGELTAIVQRARNDSAEQFSALRDGRNAAQAYKQVGEQKL
jgi:flagellar protein FliT